MLIDELTATTAEFGDHVLAVELDVTSSRAVAGRGGGPPSSRFGGLNALVNNAGVLHRAPIARGNAGRIRRLLARQLSGAVPRIAGGAGIAPAAPKALPW